MLDRSQESLLYFFDNAPCITTCTINLDNRSTILCLDVDIDIEQFELDYWGRWYNDGYQYKLYRI